MTKWCKIYSIAIWHENWVVSLPHHANGVCGALCWQTYRHDRWVEHDWLFQFDQGNVIVEVYVVGVVVFRVNVDWGRKHGRAQQGFKIIVSHVNLQINSRGGNKYQFKIMEATDIQIRPTYSTTLTCTTSLDILFPSYTTLWAAVIIQRSPITMPPPLLPSKISSTCQGTVFSGAFFPPMILW